MKRTLKKSQLPPSVRKAMKLTTTATIDIPKGRIITDLIGIDGGTHTGMVTWQFDPFNSDHDKMGIWHQGDFWSVYDMINDEYHPATAAIIIEDPNEIPPVWKKSGSKNKKTQEKIAQDVGKNKREASLLVKRFKQLDYLVVTVSPKGLGPKWSHNKFVNEMGVNIPELDLKKYNHVRDAARVLKSQHAFFKKALQSI